MVYTKFVQVGRVVRFSYGPNAGKLGVIVDILNASTVLVDGVFNGAGRKKTPVSWVTLTKQVVPGLTNSVHTVAVKKAVEENKVLEKFAESGFGKKLAARQARVAMNDFDRFKVDKARRARNMIRRKAVNGLKKAANKAAMKK